MLDNTVLVSTICQHELAKGICMFPPCWGSLPTPLPPHPTPLGCHRAPNLSFLHHTANFHQLSNFTYGNEYVSILVSPFLSPTVSTRLFSLSVSPLGFPCGSAGKESTCNAGDLGSIPGLGRFPREGKGYPLQYSGPENSIDSIVSPLLPWRWFHQYHLSRFHICVLIYICFSLFDLFHSV